MSKPFDWRKFIDGLHQYLGREVGPLFKQVKSLQERVTALEQGESKSLADAYKGGWQPQTPYYRGSLVSFNGSLWLSLADTDARPGHTPDWRLVVQRGKDGKDAAA